jgi:hypothetical protein
VQVGPERAGDEADALRHRRLAQVAEAQVEQVGDARELRLPPADCEHPVGGVDPDHRHPLDRRRDRDPAGADAQLDHRAAGGERLVDVEADVLDDRARPRVVDLRDRVVGRAHRSRW